MLGRTLPRRKLHRPLAAEKGLLHHPEPFILVYQRHLRALWSTTTPKAIGAYSNIPLVPKYLAVPSSSLEELIAALGMLVPRLEAPVARQGTLILKPKLSWMHPDAVANWLQEMVMAIMMTRLERFQKGPVVEDLMERSMLEVSQLQETGRMMTMLIRHQKGPAVEAPREQLSYLGILLPVFGLAWLLC